MAMITRLPPFPARRSHPHRPRFFHMLKNSQVTPFHDLLPLLNRKIPIRVLQT